MNLEHSHTTHFNSVVFSFFLFFPLVVTPLINFIPLYLLLTKLLCVLCFVIGCSQHGRRWWFGCIVLLSCVFYSALWSVNPPLSTYHAIQLSYYAIGFLLFRTIRFHQNALRWGIRFIVLAALIIALDGLHQYFFRYDDYARYLQEYDPFSSQEMEQAAHTWISALSGRVFTQFFALPSQLAGYLLMIFPLNAILIFHEKRTWLKLLWSIVFMLNGMVFFFTKSFGAFLVLLCMLAAATLLWFRNKRTLTWRGLLQISSGFLIAGMVLFFLVGYFRGQYLWDFRGNSPLWLRFLNWKTAIAIWREYPFFGTGLGTFGLMYPQYMQPGANEAQYAHNTYLQFGAELGIIGFVLIIFLAGSWCHSVLKGVHDYLRSEVQEKQPDVLYGIGGSFAGLGFLLHNIIDFNFYVFPLGLLNAAILGLTLNIFSSGETENTTTFVSNRRTYFAVVGLISLGIMMLFVKDWQYTRVSQHKEQAAALLQAQQYQKALQSIQAALRSSPTLPEYHAVTGSILLYLRQPDQAIVHYRTAIEAEPVTPWFHAGLAEAYLQQPNLSLAYIESRRAAELFPLKSQYQQRMQQIQDQLPE